MQFAHLSQSPQELNAELMDFTHSYFVAANPPVPRVHFDLAR